MYVDSAVTVMLITRDYNVTVYVKANVLKEIT